MIFTETPLKGAFLVDLEPRSDERGFFARTYCRREFEAHGLELTIAQSSLSLNHKAGTLRGMHFQKDKPGETKLVRCLSGAIFDVIIDLRPTSPTYGQHYASELTSTNQRALFVPEFFAHGFQTLADHTLVEYHIGAYYEPALAAGFRYDDPAFAIHWPRAIETISAQDRAWPPFSS